jgi:hypothetical protein
MQYPCFGTGTCGTTIRTAGVARRKADSMLPQALKATAAFIRADPAAMLKQFRSPNVDARSIGQNPTKWAACELIRSPAFEPQEP